MSEDSNFSKIKTLIAKLPTSGRGAEKIAKMLLQDDYSLSDVVCFQNAVVIKSFLEEKGTLSVFDSRLSLCVAMNLLDLETVEVLLNYGFGVELRRIAFVTFLIDMTIKLGFLNLQVVQVFVEQIMKWNILDKDAVLTISGNVFEKASPKALKIYLQCNFDSYVENLANINVLPYLFGNPDNRAVELLFKMRKYDLNTPGIDGATALHISASNQLFDNIKFLLDRGAEPNSMSNDGDVPLFGTIEKDAVNKQIETLKCVELLLQYGADIFFQTEIIGFVVSPFVVYVFSHKEQFDFLIKLLLAHLAIYEAAGYRIGPLLSKEGINIRDDFQNFREQLEELKKIKIRKNLTMFTIILKTGKQLFRLVNKEDQKIISEFINKHSRKLHSYHVNTLREHMRQLRNIVKCENKAMLLLSELLPPNQLILNEITSYLTYQDLLKFR